MMSDDDDYVRVSDQPHDRLTRLCVRMTEPLDETENDDVKAIVFLNDTESGGIQIHGYDDAAEAMTDLFIHMRAIFRSMGKDLSFIPVPDSPEGLSGA
jgi:hypothetical protein